MEVDITLVFVRFQLILLVLSSFCMYHGSTQIFSEENRHRIINSTTCEIDTSYDFSVNETYEYLLEFSSPNVSSLSPARIIVECASATPEHPLLVVLRQAKGVMSWQIPFLAGKSTYYKTARTLCPDINDYQRRDFVFAMSSDLEKENRFYVSLSTGSTANLEVRLSVSTVKNFTIQIGKKYTIPPKDTRDSFSPSEPHYYKFIWPKDMIALTDDQVDNMLVIVNVTSKDETCMTMSIQNISCPVFDFERTIGYGGFRQTIDQKGGVTLSQRAFPHGFYVVFIVNGDDVKCVDKTYTEDRSFREKKISFEISRTIGKDRYIVAIMAPLVVIISIYIFFFIAAVVFVCRPYPSYSSGPVSGSQSTQEIAGSSGEVPGTSEACTSENVSEGRPDIQNTSVRSCAPLPDNVSLDEIDYDTLEDAQTMREIFRTNRFIHVCDLARRDPRVLRRKSDMYVLNLITVAVFYSLPVFQLMLSYQTMLQKTGNEDQCYYNFLCALPLPVFNVVLADFNHVFSNCGYVLLGLLFILLTMRRDQMHKNAVAKRPELDTECGIPQHYGLFYAIGLALIMEGILSGLYHVCPNQTNFQFDTSFMYVMAVLCMVKLYQNRHPDINASAYSTFMVLALIIFIGMIGIIESSENSNTFFIVFSVIHLGMCLWVSMQVYHMGLLSLAGPVLKNAFREMKTELRHNPRQYITPRYPSRMALLVVGNITNGCLVYIGYTYTKDNFGSYLLTVLLTNLMLYFIFYILMKYINREKVVVEGLIYLLAATILWGSSGFFFFSRVTSWSSTPSGSRRKNEECILLEFYDYHDIWHFLSAGSMFCTFMVLLTLDDDLVEKPRHQIPVF